MPINKDIFRGYKADILASFHYGSKRFHIDNRLKGEKDYLAIACIAKNEGRYIREFIEFHLAVGVDRIYLFDNGSGDNTREILDNYIKSGKVVYFFFPGERMQFVAYRYAVRYCKSYTRWLAFIDADEFLFSPTENLKAVLKDYEDAPAIGVNWVCFGPSGHQKRPDGFVIENYLETFADKDHLFNRHIKSIVNPKLVESINSPHYCRYKKGRFAVDENHQEIDGNARNTPYRSPAFTSHSNISRIRINHYITKSFEDLIEKGKRGYPDGMPSNKYQESVDRFNVPLVRDEIILRFLPLLKNCQ